MADQRRPTSTGFPWGPNTLTGREARLDWLREWEGINRRYVEARLTQGALAELAKRYTKLEPDERLAVDGLLAESLLSTVDWRRFDALALISQFRIRSALPTLEELCRRLARSTDPGAPFDLRRTREIIEKLCENT